MNEEQDETLDVEELNVEDSQDLEAAMREALEAVEGQEREPVAVEGADETEAPGSEDAPAEGDTELAVLRKEVAELRDRSVRTLADFDNFRKRAERERLEQQRYAGSEVLRDLLDVIDNLERARDSDGDLDDLKGGVELIVRQVLDLLRRHGVERVEAEGRAFDPSVHEAVSREEDAEVVAPTVCNELQKGYVMRDRLLRPSMVVVAVPAKEAGDDENDA